ncbi:sodium:solute symporter family protein [Candidatus Aerophobetes bacterium]|nr:sodium:solute symporter family protein [Candidatus Aerophobetes bacterium]
MLEIGHYAYSGWVIGGVSIYMAVMVFIGWWASHYVKGATDYIVAGRRLPYWMLVGTLVATWFGAGPIMGGAANGYLFGMQGVIFDPFSAAICFLLTGIFFARLMRRARFITLGDVFVVRYGKTMGVFSIIVLSIAEMGWVGSQLVAFGAILNVFTGLPMAYGIIISCVVLIGYTYLGGMWAVTLTDVIQFLILTAALLIAFPLVIGHLGGWGSFVAKAGNWAELPTWAITPVKGDAGYLGYTGSMGWLYYIAAWLSIAVGSICAQDLMQRVLAGKNETVTVRACYTSTGIYLTIGLIGPLLGIAMYAINPNLTIADTELIIPWMTAHFLPPYLAVFFVCGLFAVLMSSSDSAILASASLFGNNLQKMFKPDATDKDVLRWSRIMVPIVTIVALFIALRLQTIYKLMVIAWTIILVGLFASYAAAFFWKKANHIGALASLFAGFGSWIMLIYHYLPATMEANVGIVEEGKVYMDWAVWDAVYIASTWGFIISIVTLIVVSLLTQKINPPKPIVDTDGKPLAIKNWVGWGTAKWEKAMGIIKGK